MAYIDGFIVAVPTANKEKYLEVAKKFDAMMIEHGALRVVEAWADDVPHGKTTDFFRAVQATEDETVVFSWIEWPDKETKQAGHAKIEELMKSGSPEFAMDMPFDGARMVFGSFAPILDLGGK